MGLNKIKYLLILAILGISCTHTPTLPEGTESGYPDNIASIILTKCAISGCHNNQSYINAARLNLTTWDGLFAGTVEGATVIPYRPDFSTTCYFTNSDSSMGIISDPSMPVNGIPLSKTEYLTLRDWIANGAPSANSRIPFTGDPNREKIYIANRMCNVVTILDAQTFLQMRYINVGNTAANAAFPICVKVSPDKKYWYVSFFTQTNIVQKFRADNDEPAGELNLGSGEWTSFAITSDSKYGFFVDNSSPGKIVYADLENMSALATYTFGGNFKYPSGIALNEPLKKIYIGSASGNFVYNINITNPLSPVIYEMPIDGTSTVQYSSNLNPAELLTDTTTNTCYIACEGSNEIRTYNMQHDKLIATIALGTNPAFIALSPLLKKLFISCPDDVVTFPGNRGAVVVVDVKSNTIITKIKSGYQPYGIAVNDKRQIVSVINANISGPKSHHVSGCGKKIGYISVIDLNTLSLQLDKQRELAVFPYGIANR